MADRSSARLAPPFRAALLSPKLWPTWIGLGLLRLIAVLPFRIGFAIGRMLGTLVARLVSAKRRAVGARNLELCFPELDADARARLLEQTIRSHGMAPIELGWAAFRSRARLARLPLTVEGWSNLDAARANGRGVLLLCPHFAHMELAVRLIAERTPVGGLSREQGDAAFEWVLARRRARYGDALFRREDLRPMIKYLRRGGLVWYAADHGARGKDSVFVSFFGIPAATLTGTHHLARVSGAAVVPFYLRRTEDRYVLTIEPALEPFPSDDVAADSAQVNRAIESMVRIAPEQYLWLYKRFKERPPGEPSVYVGE